MQLFGLEIKKKRKTGYTFSDGDRDLSAQRKKDKQEIENYKFEIEKIKQEKLLAVEKADFEDLKESLLGEIEGDGEETSTENIILSMLASKFMTPQTNGSPNISPTAPAVSNGLPPNTDGVYFSNEEVQNILNLIPSRIMSDFLAYPIEERRKFIVSKLPNVNPATIEKVLGVLNQ